MSFRIHFQDLPPSAALRDECERWVSELESEFPETSKFEVTLTHAGAEHETHVHITGRDLELASSAKGRGQREAIEEAFERLRRQLRKRRDKQILGRRREAQKPSRRG